MADNAPRGELRVAIIGTAFMGAVHSHAWATAPKFFDLPLRPVLQVMVGRDPERTRAAAGRFGWLETASDWREVVGRDDVDLVDICTPGDTHAEIAVAALAAGKHVLCEKPLANSVAEAERMSNAAETAAAEQGVLAMCGFTYRRVPALTLARRLVAEGRLGEIRHVRAQYLQDWLADADAPYTWRLDRSVAGSGALGDIGAHVIDATQWITGQAVTGVSALLQTFVPDRPYPSGSSAGSGIGSGGDTRTGRGRVTVDDAALFTARFDGGAIGSFEATRFALGRKNAIRIEINGSLGSLSFDFEDMNVLHLFDGAAEPGVQGFTRIVVTEPEHPYTGSWWPPGHGLGYEHSFTHQVVEPVQALAAGDQPRPSFADALAVQRVLDAVERSAAGDSGLDPRLMPGGATRSALVVRGGWDGHTPVEATERFVPFLREQGFEVRIEDSPEVYTDAEQLAATDLVLQCYTMGTASDAAVAGLRSAVAAGTGFAGWHGGIADSFRNSSDYLHLVGGQFACHPPKEPDELEPDGGAANNFLPYTVNIRPEAADHPIVAGLEDFDLVTEQYWVLSDDYVDVLATTTLRARPDDAWHRPVTSPAIWTRQWGEGRIFVATPGHSLDVLDHPSVRTVIERGLVWASR